jgi:hypothetical protein
MNYKKNKKPRESIHHQRITSWNPLEVKKILRFNLNSTFKNQRMNLCIFLFAIKVSTTHSLCPVWFNLLIHQPQAILPI